MILNKKAAMFGLEAGALRKQSGGLFLAKLRRLTFRLVAGQQATKIKTQHGAMFGLDARIALTIFGALSVISGAALYSAIQQSRATALLSELNEIGKAWESYYLDTGENPPFLGSGSSSWKDHTFTGSELVSSTKAGWSGPYLSYETSGNTLLHSQYYHIYILALSDSGGWGGSVNWLPSGVCADSNQCYVWTHISGIRDESLLEKIDAIVDSSDGSQAGNFRWRDVNSGLHYWGIYLKIAPISNPH